MEVVQFDDDAKVLLDQQGIMLTKAGVQRLASWCAAHLSHSDLELMAIGRMSVEDHGPNTVAQFNFARYP